MIICIIICRCDTFLFALYKDRQKKTRKQAFTGLVEQITGVEPASPVWETGVMTAILYLHITDNIITLSAPLVK